MNIQSPILLTPLTVKTSQSNLSQWFLGQILNATVTARKSADTLVLQINNQQINAKTSTDRPPTIGMQLKLIVEKQSDPIILRVLQQEPPKSVQEIKQQLLRENMPKQAGMEKLSTVLNQFSNNIKEVIKGFPAPIEQQVKKLIENLPTTTKLKNDSGLKSVIKDSGLFLESKLMAEVAQKRKPNKSPQSATHNNQQSIAKDLKTNLLQLSEIITKYKQSIRSKDNNILKQTQLIPIFEAVKVSTTKTKNENLTKLTDMVSKNDIESISKKVESSIARIEVNQSKAVVTNDNQVPTWSIELPVKDKHDIDLLKLGIHSDKDSKSENESAQLWTVNLNIIFENIGSLSAKVSLIDKEVSATLWSENNDLNELINNHLPKLNKQIERCGLSAGKIVCLEGAPSEQENELPMNNLINISV